MLSQLKNLRIEADGRYATEQELAFLKAYLGSIHQRMSTYEKVRDAEEVIMDQVEENLKSIDPQIFQKGTEDCSKICRRDRKNTLRHSAAAMLFDDVDRLREGLLIWQGTIVRAIKSEEASELTWQEMPKAMEEHLSSEECGLMRPSLQLTRTLLM